MPHPEWRPCPEFESSYEVSSDGQVRNAHTGFVLAAATGHAYLRVNLGRGNTRKIHVLVCTAFHGPPPTDMVDPEVDHVNDNRLDNRACNVQWLPKRENLRKQRAAGRGIALIGQANHNAILTDQQVEEIRSRYKPGQKPNQYDLAREYGVSQPTIGNYVRGVTRNRELAEPAIRNT